MKFIQYLLLTVVLLGTFWCYGYQEILFMRPNSVHMWRQADCTSYTLNYYQNSRPFFKPQTHTLTGEDGRAASEFPIIYYATAQLYKFFGPREYLLRLVNLTLFVIGLYCLFALAQSQTESYAIAWLVVGFVISSTYLVYYANNFLVNVSALSLVFCGWRCFFLYKRSGRLLWLLIMGALLMLATLLKVDAGISLVAIAVLLFLENLGALNVTPLLNKHTLPRALLFLAVCGVTVGWYAYAAWYNSTSGSGQNLLGVLPIWNSSPNEIWTTVKRIGPGKWAPHFQSYPTLAVTVFFFGYLLAHWRSVPILHRHILVWLTLGCGAYFLLWFQAFTDHDYYLINIAILPVLVWVLFLYQAKKQWDERKYGMLLAVLFVLSVYNIYHAGRLMDERYHGKWKESAHPALYTMEPYLRSIGIARTDKVISIPDLSPNITLYLINNPGWTQAFNSEDYNTYYFINQGAKYLIVSDSLYLTLDYYKALTGNQIGHYQGVNIYKLPEKQQ